MSAQKRAIEFLLSSPGWKPILASFKESWLRTGRVSGTHRIADRSEAEAYVELIGGKKLPPVGRRIYASRVNRGLEASSAGCSLDDLFQIEAGRPLTPRPTLRRQRKERWERTLEALSELARSMGQEHEFASWVHHDRSHLYSKWRKGEDRFASDIAVCLKALAELRAPGFQPVALPTFASQVSGNPHGLDSGTSTGALLVRGLHLLLRGEAGRPATNQERAALLREWNIEIDDLSSVVVVSGLRDGHPLLCSQAGIVPLTLFNVRQIEHVSLRGPQVWSIENPAVFRDFHLRSRDMPPARRPTLVLASGNPSLAVQLLTDHMMSSRPDAHLYYSGDNDTNGLALLRFWERRYPERVTPWGMAVGRGIGPVSADQVWQEDLADHLWSHLQALARLEHI